ncbi:hypothetical protein DH2020_001843 [Rehmannia glutinosa]|uniref:RNase H type-1 domain-containing protein n=1 Tax=Rehmannia glutinosa TaxID=99300 RepID=A0ABR0XS59_REHGL
MARNQACMNGECFDVERTINNAQNLFLEFQNANKEPQCTSKTQDNPRWMRSESGKVKPNMDMAKFRDWAVRYGFVVRDSEGDVLLAGMKRTYIDGSNTYLEGLALFFVIQQSMLLGFSHFYVESDSKCLIDGIQAKAIPEIGCDVVIEYVCTIAKAANVSSFSKIHRSANRLAHENAHFELNPNSERFWIEEIPSHLESVRLSDSLRSLAMADGTRLKDLQETHKRIDQILQTESMKREAT